MNSKKLFIDTSAWILSFKRNSDSEVRERIKKAILTDQVVITESVILELIQGCKSESEKKRLRMDLENLELLEINKQVWEQAYGLAYNLRRKGITIPTIDLLIAALSLAYDCSLLHNDHHYQMIADYYQELDQIPFEKFK